MRLYFLALLTIPLIYYSLMSCENNQDKHTSPETLFQTLQEAIPGKFEIEDQVEGNLNADKYPDKVYVIKDHGTKNRKLVICFGAADNLFQVVLNSPDYVLNENQEGYLSDPYVEMKLEGSTLKIIHFDRENPECFQINEYRFNKDKHQLAPGKVTQNQCDSVVVHSILK